MERVHNDEAGNFTIDVTEDTGASDWSTAVLLINGSPVTFDTQGSFQIFFVGPTLSNPKSWALTPPAGYTAFPLSGSTVA